MGISCIFDLMFDMKSCLFLFILLQFHLLTGQSYHSNAQDAPLPDDSDMAGCLEEAFTFTRYPTYEQYKQMMLTLPNDYPGLCRLDTIGFSEQGRAILVLRISDRIGTDEGEARFFYSSSMHGDELVGYVLLLRLSGYLLENYGKDQEIKRLIDSLEIYINPLSNPDGTFYPDNNLSVLGAIRENSLGFDLNRTYPDPFVPDENDTTGRPLETRLMMEYMDKYYFTMSANIHGGEEVVNYPWDYAENIYHPDNDWFYFVSREYADEARAVNPGYMSGFTDGVTIGWEWYPIRGGRQDYVTYYLHGREVTLELSIDKTPESESLDYFWEINKRSLINYMSQCLFGIRGKVSSAVSGQSLCAKVFIPGHDDENSWILSDSLSGKFYRLIKEGTYDLVFSADGFHNDTVHDVQVQDYQATWLEVMLEPVSGPNNRKVSPVHPGMLIKLYPNPAGEAIHVESDGSCTYSFRYTVYSLDGNSLLSGTASSDTPVTRIELSLLKQGLYLLKIESECGTSSLKFIKH